MKIGEFELNKIYCMDCLEGLKRLPNNSIDLVVTDPPYNINLVPQRGITKSIENDNLTDEDFELFLEDIFKEIKRIMKEDTFIICFTGWSTIPSFRKVLDGLFTLKAMPVWVKNNFGIGYYTRPQYEHCFLYLNGRPKPLKNPISDVWHFDRVLKPVHSCEKPKELIRYIIKSFSNNEKDIVLDPFMGSGTTAVACKQLDRNFIGFELSQEYVDIANKRLEQDNLSGWFQ